MIDLIKRKGSVPSCSVFIDPSYSCLMPVEISRDGQLVYASEFKRLNTHEQNKQFVFTDFSLANLIAVGSYASLHPVIMTNNTDATFVDQFSSSIASLPKE